jgi:O-antigen/teichoic acid export membrane protein
MKLFKSFSLYTIASFIEGGIAFFLLPLFTFYLTTKDFGILALLTTVFSFITPLVSLGTQGAVSVAYFKGKKDDYPSYFSSAILTPFLSALFLILIIAIFSSLIESYLGISIYWILFIPLFCFLSFFNSLLLLDYQIKGEPIKFIYFSLSSSTVNVLFSLLLVISFKLGYQGRLIGQYFSIFLFFIIALFIAYKKRGVLIKKINYDHVKDSILFGLPLIPHILGSIVLNLSDRLFIDHFFGKEQLGIYNIGYVVGSAISILCASFAHAIVPFSYELFAKNTYNDKVKVVKVYWLFIGLLIIIIFCIWMLTPILFKWFIDVKFQGGSKYVIWIALGYFFQGLYLLFANIIFYLKKTKVFFYVSFVNVILNLGLNYYLIPSLGPIGAAYATCISFFIFFITIAIYCNKVYPLPWLAPFMKIK